MSSVLSHRTHCKHEFSRPLSLPFFYSRPPSHISLSLSLSFFPHKVFCTTTHSHVLQACIPVLSHLISISKNHTVSLAKCVTFIVLNPPTFLSFSFSFCLLISQFFRVFSTFILRFFIFPPLIFISVFLCMSARKLLLSISRRYSSLSNFRPNPRQKDARHECEHRSPRPRSLFISRRDAKQHISRRTVTIVREHGRPYEWMALDKSDRKRG